jgi:tetratricopeptide (TPR) repeat protein
MSYSDSYNRIAA